MAGSVLTERVAASRADPLRKTIIAYKVARLTLGGVGGVLPDDVASEMIATTDAIIAALEQHQAQCQEAS